MTKNRQLQTLYIAFAGFLAACGMNSCSSDDGAKVLCDTAVKSIEPQCVEAAFRVGEELLIAAFPGTGAPQIGQLSEADRHAQLLALLSREDTVRSHNPYEQHLDTMPPGGIKMKINGIGGALAKVLNDSNKFHLEVAEANGIEPIYTLSQAWQQGGRMEKLHTCEAYYLDNLTHSMPYLVPKAHTLLKDIGIAFRDSLQARGGGDYRIKVTSVLRTPALVRQLRRRNRNAVDTSAHLFGTTFDISYLKFICDSARTPRTQEDMKNLLGEVVEQMRQQNRCFVKYERKQACYHITVR
jgi:uncharacterized protein YcbK (DUF882 family)